MADADIAHEQPKKFRWGDEDDDIASIAFPSKFETVPDENGVRTITEYFENENGQKMKVVRKVKKVTKEVKRNKTIYERRSWKKFGQSAGKDGIIEEGISKKDPTPVTLKLMPRPKTEQKQNRDALSNLGKDSQIVCRVCGKRGVHWSKDCPYKDNPTELKKMGIEPATPIREEPAASPVAATTSAGAYVPPNLRGSAGARIRDIRREDEATVRVSNLPQETKEHDVRELFGHFGYIHRVFLAKDKVTGASRGFAFVNFLNRSDAEKSIKTLDGHRYGHLILHVEWAKPSNPDRA